MIVQGVERSTTKDRSRPAAVARLRNREGVRVPQSTVGVAAGGAVMIRGPRRGLGTFRCRCRRSCSRWSGVSLLLLLSLPLLLLQAGRAAARVPPQPDRVNPFRGAQPLWLSSGTGLPASDFAPPHLVFQSGGQLGRPGSMAAASSSIAPMVQHHLQQLHHQKQQIGSGSGSSSLGGTAEASIIRLMSKQNNLYLEIYPNGTVGTTSQDSSYYSKSPPRLLSVDPAVRRIPAGPT